MKGLVICAWCASMIRDGDVLGGPPSHGVCFDCAKNLGLFPSDDIHQWSENELDALPIGVVGLDADGIIQEYNLTESSASGLKRDEVLGRDFFREIAPCTCVQEFRGRFEEMSQSPEPLREELDFVFKFKSGDRFAHLVFVWTPGEHAKFTMLIDLEREVRQTDLVNTQTRKLL